MRTVTAAWRVLRESQMGRGGPTRHGSTTTPSVARRPSVHHLVPRREARPATPPLVHDFHLPPSGGVLVVSRRVTPGSGRASAQPMLRQRGKPGRGIYRDHGPEPRPRDWSRSPGLDRAHIGAICDALTGSHRPRRCGPARAVNDALNADIRARGTTWPDPSPTPRVPPSIYPFPVSFRFHPFPPMVFSFTWLDPPPKSIPFHCLYPSIHFLCLSFPCFPTVPLSISIKTFLP